MRMVTRALFILFALSITSLVLIGRCGLKLHEERIEESGFFHLSDESSIMTENFYLELLRQREEEYRLETDRLRNQITLLQRKLSETLSMDDISAYDLTTSLPQSSFTEHHCTTHIEKQIRNSEINRGVQLNNEYEVIPFSHLTFSKLYPVELGLGKRVVEKPIGYRRKDLLEIFVHTLTNINRRRHKKQRYTVDDFVEGIYRNEPTTGTQYELFFRDKNDTKNYHKIVLMRPFGPVQTISKETIRTKEKVVNIIIPLSGRTDVFQDFLDMFFQMQINHDENVFLTVVYFTQEGLQNIRILLDKFSKKFQFRSFQLLALNETFSRGRGLQVGAQNWKGDPNAILFFCDVDIVFSKKFLNRCRINSAQEQRVYYPIVFSLYNPSIVYSLQGKTAPTKLEQLVISRDTGFWRDFGFGMTCQYRTDFLKIKGFDEEIIGWGGEDVMLYRKYIRSSIRVIRATDPGIFHVWHKKSCDADALPEQYRACLRSRALTEGSHAQLGLLAFHEDLKRHQERVKSNSIMNFHSAQLIDLESPIEQ